MNDYLERVRDFDAVVLADFDAVAAVAAVAEAAFFLFSNTNLTDANNTADISGARLMMSPPFVFGFDCFDCFGFLAGFCVVISILLE